MTILDKLIKDNEFPIVFLGSGMSKRFLVNFPDWNNLLEEFWEVVKMDNFYGNLNNVKDEVKSKCPELNDTEIDHYSFMRIGSIIEETYNRKFNNEDIIVDNFTPKDANILNISPFKRAISQRFNKYRFKDDVDAEYNLFQDMLLKTQIILTTNYDSFIEDSYNEISDYKIEKYIGQKGFFRETYGYSEIYKIHGCVDSPNDIIITERDYEKFNKNSVLISAKIISMLINSPIIFLGYSLTDTNVRRIIREFTSSLSNEEITFLENKLVLVERKDGEKDFIEEVVDDRDLGCKVKVIKTDNFEKVFQKISSINQGIAPSAVRKYQHVIKELIIDRGKEGTLNTVLVSPEELDKLEGDLQNKNLTVAIGDSKLIFQIPDIVNYSLDYISDNDNISTDIRLRFASMQTGRFPVHKFFNKDLINSSSLHPSEKEKLLQKTNYLSNFKKTYDSIVSTSVFKIENNDIESIIKHEQKRVNVYETLSYNIEDLCLNDLKSFLVSELEWLKSKGEIKINTQLRRLMLLYDILKNKRDNA